MFAILQYNKDNNLHPMQNLAAKDQPGGTLLHRTSDTEAQILRDLGVMQNQGTNLRGGHLEINGQLPPCSSCDRRMRTFAKKNKCTITYSPGPNSKSVSYP
jgi:hypothetical protein